MTIVYAEFDTTQASLLSELNTRILSHADWTRPNSAARPATYKCTTTRGANMVVDLTSVAISTSRLGLAAYYNYDGTTITDPLARYLFWLTSGGATTTALHVVLSLSKEHFYLQIEGPRPSEPGATSSTYGSLRNYFFICDVVPYFPVADTNPIAFCGGNPNGSSVQTLSNGAYLGHVTRNYANAGSWQPASLLTLDFPRSHSWSGTVTVQRDCAIDGNYYLAPYVVFEQGVGIRGRLASFFSAGFNASGSVEQLLPPVGSIVTYGAIRYKLHAVNKSDGSNGNYQWNQFGACLNGNNQNLIPYESPVVAIPYAEV